MQRTFLPQQVKALQQRCPALLATSAPLAAWLEFFEGLSLSPEAVYTLLLHHPSTVASSTPFDAGQVLLILRQQGWSPEDLSERLLPCYPYVLGEPLADVRAVLAMLEGLGFTQDNIAHAVRLSPDVLCRSRSEQVHVLLERIRKAAARKYSVTGAYHL